LTSLPTLTGWPPGMRVIVRPTATPRHTVVAVRRTRRLALHNGPTSASTTASAAPQTPACAGYPPASSPSTPPGARSRPPPTTRSPGYNYSPSTANRPKPNRNDRATACHTPPPASPEANAATDHASHRPGPGGRPDHHHVHPNPGHPRPGYPTQPSPDDRKTQEDHAYHRDGRPTRCPRPDRIEYQRPQARDGGGRHQR
jgi:hypothetical protein